MFKKLLIILFVALIFTGCTQKNNPVEPTDNNTDNNSTVTPTKPDETPTTPETNKEIGMNVTISTIQREASDGKENEGKETVDLKQAKISFNRLPETVDELKSIDRTGEDGKFITMALLICSFKTWNPDDETVCEEMMKELLNSPTVDNNYTAYTKSFVKERMLQNEKWGYIADAYFDGAESSYGYEPDLPLTITLREYPYLPQTSTMYGTELSIDKVVIEFEGADSERSISVYQDPTDNKWYVWSDSYKGLLTDIRFPAK